ncbi:response regulator transcription factor [Aedoeadaptatus acetigenes]|uniref:response regulator transcription factor n=1 Tax=Aedoeadaptatus acetigenes TaxID=2981723 RepID=UPI0011DD58F8|nr:response regulator transcription factor [Aedoeadaptatus acetigenes]MCU6785927.1 response regulator transcription factor [Aedoeadaptatus acetigenes]
MRLLIVEDEKELLESIAEGLRLSGYAVDTAADGAEAEDLFWSETYDLIVLDINLPKIDGFTLLKEIREEDKQVNVIMLTARTQVADRVKGLDLGANDYLIKPFHFDELEARIRSLLRRKQVVEDKIIHYKNLSFDTATKILTVDGDVIKLTAKELGIFEYLILNQGRYISAEELMEHVWDMNVSDVSNAVRVHMSALRRKIKEALGENIIRNEIGRGYVIDRE